MLAALDPTSPTGSGTARLHWATDRAPVELTPAAAQRLACDATLRMVVADGPTRLANLALICRDHHHAIHDSAWHVTLHADASMTFTRRGVTLTSHPRATQHPTPTTPPPTGRPRRHHPTHPDHPPDPAPAPADTDTGPTDPGTATNHQPMSDPTAELLPF